MEHEAAALLEELREAAEQLPPDVREALGHAENTDEAIEPLVDLVAREGTLTAAGTIAVTALQRFEGCGAVDAVLEAHSDTSDVNTRHNLADALSGFNAHDPRLLEILLERIETAPNRRKLPTWIYEIARHGNAKALPRLCAWFETAALDPSDMLDRLIAESIAYAVKTLGGEFAAGRLEPTQQAEPTAGDTRRADESPEEAPGTLRYDASSAPDRDTWLVASEHARVSAICQFHAGGGPHPEPEDLSRHAMAHAIVENHLAEDFPAIRQACVRLQEEGLIRHDAVHALGRQALVLIEPVITGDAQLAPNELIAAYQQASAADYLAAGNDQVSP